MNRNYYDATPTFEEGTLMANKRDEILKGLADKGLEVKLEAGRLYEVKNGEYTVFLGMAEFRNELEVEVENPRNGWRPRRTDYRDPDTKKLVKRVAARINTLFKKWARDDKKLEEEWAQQDAYLAKKEIEKERVLGILKAAETAPTGYNEGTVTFKGEDLEKLLKVLAAV